MTQYTRNTSTDPFKTTREVFEELLLKLSSEDGVSMEHSELEVLIEKEGREILRQAFQDHLDLRFLREKKLASVESCDGIEHRQRRVQMRSLRTIFGDARIKRWSYIAPEEITLRPSDAVLNLPRDLYSDRLVRRFVENAVTMSFDAAIRNLEQSTGVRIPKRQAEYQLGLSAVGFRDFYESRKALKPQDSDDLLVLSTDGKGVVMRYEDLREETQNRIRREVLPNGVGKMKNPPTNRKRMATVAAVYSTKPHVRSAKDVITSKEKRFERTRLTKQRRGVNDKRVWASLMYEQEEIIEEVFQEAHRRDPSRKHRWVYIVDGDLNQLKRVRRAAKKYNTDLEIVCDFVHVLEYIWRAAYCFHPKGGAETEKWVEEKALNILRGKASQVAAGIRRSATKRNLSASKRKDVDICARYLLNHKEFLKYNVYLSRGYPIASGVIEGTCRHLINDRLDITGARWSMYGAETVLKFRAMWATGELDEFWEYRRKRHLLSEHLSYFKNCKLPGLKDAA